MLHMTPSPWAFEFIKQWERFRPTAYKPTPDDVFTIGYGHTKGVKEGDTCTMSMALEWLQDDVAEAALSVCRLVNVPLNQQQFDACTSLAFNIQEPFHKTLGQLLNAKDYAGAADQFLRWKFQAGKPLEGLLNRRKAERAHFLGQDLVA